MAMTKASCAAARVRSTNSGGGAGWRRDEEADGEGHRARGARKSVTLARDASEGGDAAATRGASAARPRRAGGPHSRYLVTSGAWERGSPDPYPRMRRSAAQCGWEGGLSGGCTFTKAHRVRRGSAGDWGAAHRVRRGWEGDLAMRRDAHGSPARGRERERERPRAFSRPRRSPRASPPRRSTPRTSTGFDASKTPETTG